MSYLIRAATPGDIPALLGLVQELADYEKEPDAPTGTPDSYRAALFPSDGDPVAYAHIAEVDGEVVGCALWYRTFSSWEGTGIWLEDLYVRPEHRAAGIGKALLRTLARICADRGYARLEWVVLTWNEPAIGFYESLGADRLDEWWTYRLTGPALAAAGTDD